MPVSVVTGFQAREVWVQSRQTVSLYPCGLRNLSSPVNEDSNYVFFIGLLRGLNETMGMKVLAQWLEHKKPSMNVS
jgi:hypothetical protein